MEEFLPQARIFNGYGEHLPFLHFPFLGYFSHFIFIIIIYCPNARILNGYGEHSCLLHVSMRAHTISFVCIMTCSSVSSVGNLMNN